MKPQIVEVEVDWIYSIAGFVEFLAAVAIFGIQWQYNNDHIDVADQSVIIPHVFFSNYSDKEITEPFLDCISILVSCTQNLQFCHHYTQPAPPQRTYGFCHLRAHLSDICQPRKGRRSNFFWTCFHVPFWTCVAIWIGLLHGCLQHQQHHHPCEWSKFCLVCVRPEESRSFLQ